jgi:hypothetical protein
METITFKLGDQLLTALEQTAEQWNGISCHRAAKHIVVTYLRDAERARLRQEITDLHKEVIRLREDLATAVAVLLARGGKPTDPKEAQAWAERTFLASR